MIERLRSAGRQFPHLFADLGRSVGGKRFRWLSIWWTPTASVLISYRLNRAGYLLLGRSLFGLVRGVLAPVFFLLRPWTVPHEIAYQADIGPGLHLLHLNLGVVVSGNTVAGRNLCLIGGNVIGQRRSGREGPIVLGDDVTLGAGALVLGPLHLGDRVTVGAGAVVIDDAPDGAILVGSPARRVETPTGRNGLCRYRAVDGS